VKRHEKALSDYAQARKNGLQPPNTLPGAVDKMEQEMESQARGLKKLEDLGHDVSQVTALEGVKS
jgi:hypothetical protein